MPDAAIGALRFIQTARLVDVLRKITDPFISVQRVHRTSRHLQSAIGLLNVNGRKLFAAVLAK
jgi:hypothetical protein